MNTPAVKQSKTSQLFEFLADYSNAENFSLKKWIIDYFDYVINKIDLEAEYLLLNSRESNEKEDLNKIRMEYVSVIEKMQIFNLTQYETNKSDLMQKLDKYYHLSSLLDESLKNGQETQTSLVDLKRSLFKEFCIYIEKELLDALFGEKNLIGALVVSDYYLDESFVRFLRNLVKADISFNSSQMITHEFNYANFNAANQDADSELDEMEIILDQNLLHLKLLSNKLYSEDRLNLIIHFDSMHISNQAKLDMRNYGLKSIANNIFKETGLLNLMELDLSSNKIDMQIKSKMFAGLRNLKALNLSSNQIDIIEVNAFEHLTSLKRLDLNSNKIEHLFGDVFTSSLSQLEYVDLSQNRIKSIKGGLFSKLASLSTLNLSTNKFDSLEFDSFKGLANLTHLYLCNYTAKSSYSAKIKQIDKKSFSDLINLRELFLTNQNLLKLDWEIFKNLKNLHTIKLKSIDTTLLSRRCFSSLINLKRLGLQGDFQNYLSEQIELTPADFKHLQTLNELEMTNYWIRSVSIDAFKYLSNNLTVLRLSQNKLESFDMNCLNCLKQLRCLDLSENRLTQIGEFKFSNQINLEELNLKDNSIETIYFNTFSGLANLKILNLSENSLCNLQSGSFNCLTNLKCLDLSKSNITKLTKYDFFENLHNLEELYLKSLNLINNKLRPDCRLNIEENAFSNLGKLKILNLQFNSIEKISKPLMNGLNNLIELNLSFNTIRSIEEDSFAHMINLKELFLNNNQINSLNTNSMPKNSLQSLDLSDNLIEIRDEAHLSELFAQFEQLKRLKITNNHVELANVNHLLLELLPGLVDFDI